MGIMERNMIPSSNASIRLTKDLEELDIKRRFKIYFWNQEYKSLEFCVRLDTFYLIFSLYLAMLFKVEYKLLGAIKNEAKQKKIHEQAAYHWPQYIRGKITENPYNHTIGTIIGKFWQKWWLYREQVVIFIKRLGPPRGVTIWKVTRGGVCVMASRSNKSYMVKSSSAVKQPHDRH